jgi:hypothetical protein
LHQSSAGSSVASAWFCWCIWLLSCRCSCKVSAILYQYSTHGCANVLIPSWSSVALQGPSSISRSTSCHSCRCSESSQLRSTATLSWATWPLVELVSLLLGMALQRHTTHLASSTRVLLAQVSTWACTLDYIVVCSDCIVDPHLIYFWIMMLALCLALFIFNLHQFSFSNLIIDYRWVNLSTVCDWLIDVHSMRRMCWSNLRAHKNSWIGYCRLLCTIITELESGFKIEVMASWTTRIMQLYTIIGSYLLRYLIQLYF